MALVSTLRSMRSDRLERVVIRGCVAWIENVPLGALKEMDQAVTSSPALKRVEIVDWTILLPDEDCGNHHSSQSDSSDFDLAAPEAPDEYTRQLLRETLPTCHARQILYLISHGTSLQL